METLIETRPTIGALLQRGKSVRQISKATGLSVGMVMYRINNHRRGVMTQIGAGQCQPSKCSQCNNFCCSWMQSFTPVDGWTAEPSKLYKNGWAVSKCPEYIPFPKREITHERLSNLDPLRRCIVCGAVIGTHCSRTKYCSDACYRKEANRRNSEAKKRRKA